MRLWCAALGFGCWVRSQPGFSWFCVFLLIGLLPSLVPEKRWKKGKKNLLRIIVWKMLLLSPTLVIFLFRHRCEGVSLRQCIDWHAPLESWFYCISIFFFCQIWVYPVWLLGKGNVNLSRLSKMLDWNVICFCFFLVLFLFKLWVYLFALARNDGKMWFLQPILTILFYLLMWEKFIGPKQYKIIK